jgi:hypothetical protein
MHDHTQRPRRDDMLSLSDDQLQIVMTAAGALPPEKRSLFLERLAARLRLRGPRFTADDLDEAMRLAMVGLAHGGRAA